MNSKVRVVSFEAVPLSGTEAAETASGAYANVYLLAPSDEFACQQAEREVLDAGWTVATTPQVIVVSRESFLEDSDGLSHYEQCLTDGVVIVLHGWRQEH
jgi:hypothetical protein